MATGVSLQESYLRGRGSERSSLGVPAVSRNTHQLTSDPFRSKIPLEFKAERLEEHPKPTRVEVEELETLAGGLEAERLVCEEVIDSHRAPQHISHVETKVVARRIQIEEPLRLSIRRKPPEEVLRVKMLKHAARVDDLALEIFRGHAASAIYIVFEDSSSESTRALGVRTCAESPAMLTKRSHVTALRVVATRTQVVLHTDDASVIGQLRKIAAIEGYEEWGEKGTVWKLPRLRATATVTRATTSTRARAGTTTALDSERQPCEAGTAILWRQGAMSAGTGLDSSKVHFGFETPYLHRQYSREAGYLQRTAKIAIQGMKTTVRLGTDQQPRGSGSAIRWEWGARSADMELDSSSVCLEFETFYLHLRYSRDYKSTRRKATDIRGTAVLRTMTMTTLGTDRRLREAKTAVRWGQGAMSAGKTAIHNDVRATSRQSECKEQQQLDLPQIKAPTRPEEPSDGNRAQRAQILSITAQKKTDVRNEEREQRQQE
ncbi:hypothetical protein M404DRAFT_29244 [Pisolithus tinctorius Marx 270]|uniref:Uncharacterized protein n=1 Tax=Pisolithus tinctorius Marx 270 TaxID=870435 RepID=A0A0C3NIQ1_PISTI|nr:hypothetical protein M404DRAFT_29244 [Pisolithus tinctorius Marx 270]